MAETSGSPPGQAPTTESAATVPVVVKKYANRRLYNTETSSYITLDNLAEMIRAGRDFVVYDAKSGEDITRGVLTQIIVEEESKGSSMLPTAFLRQLIGFYGGSLQGVVPRYLEHAMASFARQQQQMRQVMQQTLGPFMPVGVDELSRQNMALFERAITMWNPLYRGTERQGEEGDAPATLPMEQGEIERLRHEVESLKQQLAMARADAIAPKAMTALPPAALPQSPLAAPPQLPPAALPQSPPAALPKSPPAAPPKLPSAALPKLPPAAPPKVLAKEPATDESEKEKEPAHKTHSND